MSEPSSSEPGPNPNHWAVAGSVTLKSLVLLGGALLLKRFTKSTTRWDHARAVAQSLSGEKCTREQADRDPEDYFNLRWLCCPAAEMVDGSKVLYLEQAFRRTPRKPFRQRFFLVNPCAKEMNCDVEVSAYAIRDAEEYKNFCDRPRDQRPKPEEVIADIAEHLTTIPLKCCERGKSCLYEGSSRGDGFPKTWLRKGASYSTSELAVLKNNEIHAWDRGYDDDGNQVWGVKRGPYEFRTAPASSSDDMHLPLNVLQPMDKLMEVALLSQE